MLWFHKNATKPPSFCTRDKFYVQESQWYLFHSYLWLQTQIVLEAVYMEGKHCSSEIRTCSKEGFCAFCQKPAYGFGVLVDNSTKLDTVALNNI